MYVQYTISHLHIYIYSITFAQHAKTIQKSLSEATIAEKPSTWQKGCDSMGLIQSIRVWNPQFDAILISFTPSLTSHSLMPFKTLKCGKMRQNEHLSHFARHTFLAACAQQVSLSKMTLVTFFEATKKNNHH